MTRSLWALPALLLLLLTSCRREESLELGSPARYDLQDIFGDCLGDSVVGNYVAGRALNGDSSYIVLKVNVRTLGNYSINSDIQNGFSFAGTGTFSDTGLVSLRIPARGTPQQAVPTTLRFTRDSAFCEVIVNVTATAQGGGTCNAQVAGNYYKDTALLGGNNVTLTHNYSAAGTYNVTTDTINGYFFSKSVVVTTPGATTIVLNGSGTPAATGTHNFTVRFGDSTSCGFPVTVGAPPPAGGCGGSITGTYTAGTPVPAGNGIQVSGHAYAQPGSYTISAAPVNGVSFASTNVNVTAAGGTPTATLAATGTPTAAGTFTVPVNFGDGSTCTYTLTVVTGGTTPSGDYFPLGANSYWTYTDPSDPTDTVKHINEASTTVGTQTYRVFREYNSLGNVTDSFLFRKEAGTTYQAVALEDLGLTMGVTFPAGALAELPVVKDALTTGASWTSAAYSGSNSTQIRAVFNCVNNNVTLTVNGRTYTNVYQVTGALQFNIMNTGWQNNPFGGDLGTAWFAPGVGIIQQQVPGLSGMLMLRYYQIF
ncbi:hypothetical protein EPD60_03325 [Flaviaesturariibacter flavus]|uniref:Uncharacterized protein n=1 Tax=Flaviaesturariibacter flavus TaxID=2502780 RepID=A0A4R1BN95_9BACT|nr:hypothetical protein EPD60_03325 [Flaviaesturariibacter flavus]